MICPHKIIDLFLLVAYNDYGQGRLIYVVEQFYYPKQSLKSFSARRIQNAQIQNKMIGQGKTNMAKTGARKAPNTKLEILRKGVSYD